MNLADQFPTFLRLAQKCPNLLKWSRRAFFASFCLITFLTLFITVENFRAQRAWDAYQCDAVARGVIMHFADLAPPPVPDDQNFAMTPLLKPIFSDADYEKKLGRQLSLDAPRPDLAGAWGDWQAGRPANLTAWVAHFGQPDILSALKKYDATLAEISAASRLPYSRFPIDYGNDPAWDIIFPQLTIIQELSRVFELRALAELAAGKPDRAAEDTVTILRLAQAQKIEPTLIAVLVSASELNFAEQVLWDGLGAHRWSASQLATIQSELEKIDLLPRLLRGCQGERAFVNDDLTRFLQQDRFSRADIATKVFPRPAPVFAWPFGFLAPRFVYLRALLSANLFYDQIDAAAPDVAQRHFNPKMIQAAEQAVEDALAKRSFTNPKVVLLALVLPAWSHYMMLTARAQTSLDEASLACALERFRLAHGHYPDSLDALVPQFIAQLPHDVISGGPLHYQRTAGGSFLLYSVGWNETDDHGLIAKDKNGNLDPSQGDWVWPTPPL